MNTTIEFLDAVKSKHGVVSDYALAKVLGVKQQTVNCYRHKNVALGDETAIRVAELLELEPATVLAAVHAERAKTEKEKAAWKLIYEKLGGIAASVALAALLLPASPTAARAVEKEQSNMYIMSNVARAECTLAGAVLIGARLEENRLCASRVFLGSLELQKASSIKDAP